MKSDHVGKAPVHPGGLDLACPFHILICSNHVRGQENEKLRSTSVVHVVAEQMTENRNVTQAGDSAVGNRAAFGD